MSFRKSFLATSSLCTGVLLAALAVPAFAADQAAAPAAQPVPQAPPAPASAPAASPDQSTAVTEIVVTGSMIKTKNFTSPAPIDVITAEQSSLAGNVDTTQILQLAPVAANAEQVNNFYTGFVNFAGGAGANTLSLRGLGADRTLILLNGERMGPAGVSGEVGPVDLNTIPSSMIDHVEILKDGASSIYGSDAVAGVVNIITKTQQDGGDLHVYLNPSQEGGGNSYQVNGSWGKTFDKGYFTVSADAFRQDAVLVGDRGYLDCARDLVTTSPGGSSADIIDPATGQSKCFNAIVNTVIDAGLGNPLAAPTAPLSNAYVANPSAVTGGGAYGLDLAGFQAADLQICQGGVLCPPNAPANMIDTAASRNSLALVPFNAPVWNNATALSPVSRYTVSLFGGYDLTPRAHLYASFIASDRESEQVGSSQFFTLVNFENPFNQALGYNPNTGCVGFCFPEPVLPQLTTNSQSVQYYRGVVGLKGDLPSWGSLTNWTYDVYGQVAYSDGAYTEQYVKADRVNATAGAGFGTNGCDVNADIVGGETMAQAEPGVACVPVNYLGAVINGGFTPQEMAFLYSSETGHTTYLHEYVQGSATGNLFNLPAGPVGAAIGVQIRHEALDDVPGADFINENVYNESTSGITKGSVDAEEVFGELQLPLLDQLPFVKSLNLDLSGRFSNYSSYGSNVTYKATGDWKVNDWLAVRGTYGTAFRAPALFEEFLSPSTGFLNQQGNDPCIDWATSGVSPTIQANCARQGIPGNYAGVGQSLEDIVSGGSGLKPETSSAETVGFVLTPRWGDQHIDISIDYYDYDIDNQIVNFGAGNILFQCYNSTAAVNPATNLPNSPFCSFFTRDLSGNPNDPAEFNVLTVNDAFRNVVKEVDQGLDLDINYSTPLPHDFKMTVDANLDWTFYTNYLLGEGVFNNYLGSIGQPRFVGTTDFKFDRGPWTFNFNVYMIGPSSDDPFSPTTIAGPQGFRGTGQTVYANYSAPFYETTSFTIRRKLDKFTVEAGVKNLFNSTPPAISAGDDIQNREGLIPQLASQYDLIGRSFFLDIDSKF